MKCPVCGAAELAHDTRDLPYTYKGETTVIDAVTCSAKSGPHDPTPRQRKTLEAEIGRLVDAVAAVGISPALQLRLGSNTAEAPSREREFAAAWL